MKLFEYKDFNDIVDGDLVVDRANNLLKARLKAGYCQLFCDIPKKVGVESSDNHNVATHKIYYTTEPLEEEKPEECK